MSKFLSQLKKTKQSQEALGNKSLKFRNKLLLELAKELQKNASSIIKANTKDLGKLKDSDPLRDRLKLDKKRISGLIASIKKVVKLSDPLGKVLYTKKMQKGLFVQKISVPLGVLGIIYESRPNVTIDLTALGLKSGNALVLKGGKEAHATNLKLVSVIHKVLKKFKLPTALVYLVGKNDDWKKNIFKAHNFIDVLVPRGSQNLINFVRKTSEVPVIETGAGVCHTFVDAGVDVKSASKIIYNAKTQRPSVCNSLDTLVAHETIVKDLLLKTAPLLAKKQVKIYADLSAHRVLQHHYPPNLLFRAKQSDFGKEFLSLAMSIKTVNSFEQGLKFVKEHTSHHSEAIIAKNKKHAEVFLNEIDAASVLLNTSTRFTDGEQFGLGAEVGISTQKLHARGPMGLEALTSYKWLVKGSGQVRSS